jgi:hypothetical protein
MLLQLCAVLSIIAHSLQLIVHSSACACHGTGQSLLIPCCSHAACSSAAFLTLARWHTTAAACMASQIDPADKTLLQEKVKSVADVAQKWKVLHIVSLECTPVLPKYAVECMCRSTFLETVAFSQ